jgi:hypothetical protein
MSDAAIINVPLNMIDINPHRRLGDYPYIERKVEALMRSYADIGMWPGGVVARKTGGRYQLAFGHHRKEAARRSGMKAMALTIMDLSDEQMLGYMGRENMEDFNADFLVMLETWEAARDFLLGQPSKSIQPTNIARVLGWTVVKSNRNTNFQNDTATACVAASELIAEKLIQRSALEGLTVKEAREVCGGARKIARQITEISEQVGAKKEDIAAARKQVGKAVTRTLADLKDKQVKGVTGKNLRETVAVNTYRFAKEARKESKVPLFAVFAKSLVAQIARWNNSDTVKDKIDEMIKSLPSLELLEDLQALDRVVLALEHSVMRNEASINNLCAKPAAVVKLRAIEGDLR